MSKIYKCIKFGIFIVAAILILIFNEKIMHNEAAILNGVVGAVIAYYGLEGILIPIFTKNVKKEQMRMLTGGVNILIAITMIFLLEGNPQEVRIVCVLWSLWSIIREAEEIFEKVLDRIKKHPVTSFINLAESIVVIVLSIQLIVAKDAHELLHHAHVHVILMGIELILEVVWEHIDHFEELIINRIKHKKENEA